MKKISFILAGIALATWLLFSGFNAETIEENEPESITWVSMEEAVELAKKDGKKILVDFTTVWCRWCKVMDQKTFSETEVSNYLAENFHLAKFNAEQKEELSFNGKKYTFIPNGKRGYHEFAADILNGQLAYPSLVIFDNNLNKLEVVRGFKNPEELMKILKENT